MSDDSTPAPGEVQFETGYGTEPPHVRLNIIRPDQAGDNAIAIVVPPEFARRMAHALEEAADKAEES